MPYQSGTWFDDTLHGTDTMDTIVSSFGNDEVVGLGGDDVLNAGDGDDGLFGGDGADTILGGRGNDWILGGYGNDEIEGGWGSDTMHGGHGSDIFRFVPWDKTQEPLPTHDEIGDFNQVDGDRIDVSSLVTMLPGGTDGFEFIGLGEFTKAGQLRFVNDERPGGSVVYGNTDADLDPEFSIFLARVTSLSEGDFIL